MLRYIPLLRPALRLMWPALRLVWRLLRDRRVPAGLKVLPALAVLYVISPLDVIPDFLPVRGQLDDIVIAGVLLLLFVVLSPWPVVLEHVIGRSPPKRPDSQGEGRTIEAKYRVEEDEEPDEGREASADDAADSKRPR